MLDAMADVVAKHFLLQSPQRRPHGGDLGDDVDTITILLDHARETAHLALDAAEAFAG